MYITCTPIVKQRRNNAQIICHGFGFDSLANEYKLVSVYRTSQKELNLIVFTLGTKSWRDVTAASTPISVHGLPITRVRAATGKDKQAIFCSNYGGGCLVWKITVGKGGGGGGGRGGGGAEGNNNEMEMLLLFNLHDEKFQFIQVQSKGTTGEEQKQSLFDYPHPLEFKGYPCIARIEKSSGNNGSDCYNPVRHHRHGSGSCCCCCKVHLYIFKDNVKQVWVKEESLDVCVKPLHHDEYWPIISHQAPDPCCFCFGSTTTPPTRIFSFSDQIFLYWFNGRHLQVFDLRSKKLQLASAYYAHDDGLFKTKMKEPSDTLDDSDDNIYCSSMDYQLHCQGENFLSLQSFVPEGVGRNIQVLKS
ncbi:uncharacterized protein LOC113322616 [Papaver somniferum]|uniref:uncharacterized protein LOC113322616 n=1 Tax=Papaver somniferum TaxID=3469 RepID=UPI000E6FBFA9|nr:uncharacterized protein LOC113322616 [Papaver somniferum]